MFHKARNGFSRFAGRFLAGLRDRAGGARGHLHLQSVPNFAASGRGQEAGNRARRHDPIQSLHFQDLVDKEVSRNFEPISPGLCSKNSHGANFVR